jgi:acetylornithine deacetylase/succinyl-diaminopimelate desuccinylase-like protein
MKKLLVLVPILGAVALADLKVGTTAFRHATVVPAFGKVPAFRPAQAQGQPNWTALQNETLQHYQALLRFDTSDPPGNERPAAEYIKQALEREGIPAQLFELEPNRTNVVARLKGNGSKRPLLIMAHTDVVTVDPKKWTFPPFSATRDGGYVYGRGTVDDKDNVTASLMTMLLLKRLNVPLARDVIFLAEAGEEGTTRVGIQFMVQRHFDEIDSEFCLAEGGSVVRVGGRVAYASLQSAEKIPHAIELTASGTAGHGSVPLADNAVVRLSTAVAAVAAWKPPIRLSDTTRTYFSRLAALSSPQDAARYRAVLEPESKAAGDAVDYFAKNEPRHASMLRTSISPTIIQGGYRVNVIPSEAKATLDVRLMPGEDPAVFLDLVRKVVNDPGVRVDYAKRDVRPGTPSARLDTEPFKVLESAVARHYDATLLPTMSTGATDMAYLRAKGIQCYGIGPAIDVEDGPKGFGAHSDQERLLESELHRFVRFNWDIVNDLARLK